eukprot:14220417-Ditylum_brightwellii.AAC.1
MRVYCEDQLMDDLVDDLYSDYVLSAIHDATKCEKDLQGKTPAPSTHRTNSFKKRSAFLVNELTEDDYDVQGPVLKLLQLLFNKMFICCGQTAISVISDMTWATLL